jgi:hypothetical protein
MKERAAALCIALAAGLVGAFATAQAPDPDPARFEKDIAAFEAEDRASPPPAGAALFVGSSSIRYWDVGRAFPGLPAIKRGYGGSHVSDTIHFAGRIVFPYRPRLIVFYAGDADVAAGKTADQIAHDFKSFVALVHEKLPATPIVIIGIKPSPAHWSRIETIRGANALVQKLVAGDRWLAYADVDTPLVGADGQPRRDFYVANGLNLSEAGYQAWTDAVRPIVQASWARAGR